MPCGAVRSNKDGKLGFSFVLCQLTIDPLRSAPVSFRLKLASNRDTGGRIFDQIPRCLVRFHPASLERRY